MRYTLLLFSLLFSIQLFSFEPYYHTVKAQSGDGIYSLLRRYHLLDYNCNKAKFCELNNIKLEEPLIVGREYFLPIKIFEYNGTSIRTTIGINDWDQAVRIQQFNETILEHKLRRTKYSDSNILWVPHHELECARPDGTEEVKVAEKPSTDTKKGTYRQIDLYGKDHKMVEILSNDLKDHVYYLVSGHGGPDPGAQCSEACAHTISEDEYAYDIILRLGRYLIAQGATVYYIIQDKNDGIRDDSYLDNDYDETCMGAKIPRDNVKRLRQRAVAINELYKSYKKKGVDKQVALMIHVDSYVNHDFSVDTYFYHHKTSKSSKKLAESLQNTFKEKYNHFQKNRGYRGTVKTRNLYMINNTLPTSAYVELGNIQNSVDQKRLLDASNREALAKWLYEGILAADL